ncbi:MAG: hypothetical protein ABI689_00305 [Thermoanaerobaculia bacterium]
MYERHSRPLLKRPAFHRRLLLHFLLAFALIAGSLGLGMVGYVFFERLSWLDAFLNSAMLLGGMGPVDMPHTAGGKLFAGLYALYAGLLFLLVAGIVFAPVLHRLMHRFHLDSPEP